MKKFITLFIFIISMSAITFAEEIQLTDYIFIDAKRMPDGYSYVEGDLSRCRKFYQEWQKDNFQRCP